MSFFKRKLRSWLYEDDSNNATRVDEVDHHDLRGNDTLTFHIIPANGGRIVQVRKYDTRQDRNITSLHIVTPDEDLPTSLAHILALEKLNY